MQYARSALDPPKTPSNDAKTAPFFVRRQNIMTTTPKAASQAYLAAQGDVEGQLTAALNIAVRESAPSCVARVAQLLLQGAAAAPPSSGPLPMPRVAHPANAAVDAWLAREALEPVLEPELPIIDAHHHLWDHRVPQPWAVFRTKFYDAAEFAHDIAASGHNVVGTVYVQAGTHHLAKGPAELRPCGEVEYCQGVAAQCESGVYAAPRLCWGIQGYADLRHGVAAAPVARTKGAAPYTHIGCCSRPWSAPTPPPAQRMWPRCSIGWRAAATSAGCARWDRALLGGSHSNRQRGAPRRPPLLFTRA